MPVRRRSFFQGADPMPGPGAAAGQAEGSPYGSPVTPGPHGGGVNPQSGGGTSLRTLPTSAPIPATPEDQPPGGMGGPLRPGNASLYTQPHGAAAGTPGANGLQGATTPELNPSANGLQPHLMLRLLRYMGRL